MADFRPLVLDGTQIEELDGANDRLMVRDIVSVLDSGDSIRFSAADNFNVKLGANTRFNVNPNGGFFLSSGNTTLNILTSGTNTNSLLQFGDGTGNPDQCVFDYETSSIGDNAKKLTLKMEGLTNTNPRQIVGIQTNLIGIGTVYNTAVVIPSRGNIAGNIGTKNDRYYLTNGICNFDTVSSNTDAAAAQFGLGLSIIKGGNNQFGPAIEFVKNRGDVTAGLTQSEFNALAAPQNDDTIGLILAGGSVGAGTSDPPMSGAIAFKASQNWSTSKKIVIARF